jgi:predicted helicase
LHKHFGKSLADKNVEILDPATGTGTFICDIIDYLPKNKLEHKYKHELHANELAILPYYIANLNIEFTYKQKMGKYEEFENLCLVDTLDNTGFHWIGKQGDLFGVSAENAARIKKQNERKISVIIGNPPYNANQQNENENNKNREYPMIDKRIKETFIKNSTAQKTKMYDMYSRFYRWAMDRLNENGIIAFITNRSFIESRTFDGFRKIVQSEFDYAYILDTKSDVRANPKIAGTTHNVFGIQAGVAILFLVKTSSNQLKPHDCRIEYFALEDEMRKEEKLQWIAEHGLEKIDFEFITPSATNDWIQASSNNWLDLLPLCTKEAKAGKSNNAILKLFTPGYLTGRDEWVIDYSQKSINQKVQFYLDEFGKSEMPHSLSPKIKWSRNIKTRLNRRQQEEFSTDKISEINHRPFNKKKIYNSELLIDERGLFHKTNITETRFINFLSVHSSHEICVLIAKGLVDYCYLKQGNGGTQCIPEKFKDLNGDPQSNITPWANEQFTTKYQDETINDLAIFHYVYAVLHHPAYRKKYEINLKREFPRIPLYDDFWQWAKWGEELMNLHLNYETIEPWGLIRKDIDQKEQPKAKLKAEKTTGVITIDENTELHGIPTLAWTYKLGNRSALEWILDQYKEKKPSDPTIAEKFNTYRFADYKDKVIELLDRVCRVSVVTMEIIGKMPESSPE